MIMTACKDLCKLAALA